MILVTGATGHFGKAAIQFLIAKGVDPDNINAFVRDETKAAGIKSIGVKLRIGDYDNYPSLVQAFTGIDKLLLVSGNDIQNRGRQQENAVNAAKEAGIPYIIYTSFDRQNNSPESPIAMIEKAHIDTENWIKESGIPYTILRNTLYADFVPMFAGDKVADTGVFFPAGDTKSAFATRSDMAEAAATILTTSGHENKEYTLSHTEGISFGEIAEIISEAMGKKINYVNPDQETYKNALTQAGVPAEFVGMFAGFGEAIRQGEFSSTSNDLESLLGRKPTTVREFLLQFYSAK